jgi:hypothetical protein
VQRVLLSDDRWLELSIRFDGLGIHAEVTYFDPALAVETIEALVASVDPNPTSRPDEAEQGVRQRIRDRLASWCEFVLHGVPSPVLASVLLLACLMVIGSYITYRHITTMPSPQNVLQRSAALEKVDPAIETEHRTLRIELLDASGKKLEEGRVEVWQDGNAERYVRHLYNIEDRLLASEWQSQDGHRFTTVSQPDEALTVNDRSLIADGLWKHDISSRAFQGEAMKNSNVISTKDGYEVTRADVDVGHPDFVSETLVVDHEYRLLEERLRVRRGVTLQEVRFVQTMYRKERRSSIPDSIFQPHGGSSSDTVRKSSNQNGEGTDPSSGLNGSTAQLNRLHIAVLFELNTLGADTAEPIAVDRIAGGRIRVTGVVANDQRLARINILLRRLPDQELLENRLTSFTKAANGNSTLIDANAPTTRLVEKGSELPITDEALRSYFQKEGLSGAALDARVLHFSGDALQRAQRALQNAYALDRLGSILTDAGIHLDAVSQQKWAAMVRNHAAAVKEQLQALRSQLQTIYVSASQSFDEEAISPPIRNPAEFQFAARELRENVQTINQQVGIEFAGSAPKNESKDLQQTLGETLHSLPLSTASRISTFALNLSRSVPQSVDGQSRRAGAK